MGDAGDDARWLASLSVAQLQLHVDGGCDVKLHGFPAGRSVALDLRVYDGGVVQVRGVPPEPTVHVVALLSSGADGDGPPDASCVATFFAPKPEYVTVVTYVHAGSTLSVAQIERKSVLVDGDRGDNDEGEERVADVGNRGVAVYSLPHDRAWRDVAGSIDAVVLFRAGAVRLGVPVVFGDDSVERGQRRENEDEPETTEIHDDLPVRMAFQRLPELRRTPEMSAAEVTEFNMDRSTYVQMLVATRYGGRFSALLGEMQLAFVSFIALRSVDGLVQWASILRELAACDDLAIDAPQLVASFARCLAAQLRLVDQDILEHLGDRRIEHAVLSLIAGARVGVPDVQILADAVSERFGWTPGPEHE
jgi:AAR2 protein